MAQLPGFTTEWDGPSWLDYDPKHERRVRWDEATARIELLPGIESLDLRKDKGLLVGVTAREVNDAYFEGIKEGKPRIALPIIPVDGQVVQMHSKHWLLCVKSTPAGALVYAPGDGDIEPFSMDNGRGGGRAWGFYLWAKGERDKTYVSFYIPKAEESLFPKGGEVRAGQPVIRLDGSALPEDFAVGLLAGLNVQLAIVVTGGSTLEQLQRDPRGRLVYLQP